MSSIEMLGKTVDEALKLALGELETTVDNVDYVVLEPGSKGIFGFGSRLARIKVTRKFEPKNIAKIFLREVCICMGLVVDLDIKLKDNHMDVILSGNDMGVLIGKRGQTLDSLQYLTNLSVNKGNAPYVSITLDAENYREKRKNTLENLSRNIAKRVKSTKKDISLEPMNPYERRIIHSALQGDRFVTTHSQGDEPYRYVVISNKK